MLTCIQAKWNMSCYNASLDTVTVGYTWISPVHSFVSSIFIRLHFFKCQTVANTNTIFISFGFTMKPWSTDGSLPRDEPHKLMHGLFLFRKKLFRQSVLFSLHLADEYLIYFLDEHHCGISAKLDMFLTRSAQKHYLAKMHLPKREQFAERSSTDFGL